MSEKVSFTLAWQAKHHGLRLSIKLPAVILLTVVGILDYYHYF